ncbi:Universal stress protein F [Falsiruegeria litorea R37]|uniref:Universal stress protein F n=1 Tax=Falsiruegeria litorea R37 TaxID=1200284 RepID=A0A1Y5TZC8_9RHOB|nr:universal stress protein [Falsiruegeria litorea]SLN72371.1 Universal stress protein F [Falsiruegeria litorea R37]
MYQNILVPVSFDADRDVAQSITVAQALRQPNGTVTLLHVVEHMPQYTSDLLPENHFDIAKAAITDKLKPLIGDMPETKIDIVEGHAGRGILDYATAQKTDCIVLASHRPGLQDYLLGSTAARVVRHAGCSVHVVR